jgi:hypothetical protein
VSAEISMPGSEGEIDGHGEYIEDDRLPGFRANYEAGREPASQIEADWHEFFGRRDHPGRWDPEPEMEAGS